MLNNFKLINTPTIEQIKELHILCQKEFTNTELEDFDIWQKSFDCINSKYITIFSVIIENNTNKVIAGAVQELYLKSVCGLISYIVVDNEYRGCKLAKHLIDKAYFNLLNKSINLLNKPLNYLFIESEHANNNTKCIIRQTIWKKLNFVPLNINIIHPAHMKGKTYNLAILNNFDKLEKHIIIKFIQELFEGILQFEHINIIDYIDIPNIIDCNAKYWQ